MHAAIHAMADAPERNSHEWPAVSVSQSLRIMLDAEGYIDAEDHIDAQDHIDARVDHMADKPYHCN